ncbi:MAG: hypothetical protein L7F77_01890 [Candidatus Magnetominusculus sp. LBB02]|nr:hypothetical protein [Candidatus Magnetominusculus sp. LBB02]
MGTLNDIEMAITALTEDDLARLRDWFEEFDAEVWDRKYEQDAKSGRLKQVSDMAVSEFKQGRFNMMD